METRALENLRGADVSGIVVGGDRDLRCVDLTDAVLVGANLAGVTFDGAILEGATLVGADLEGASFARAERVNILAKDCRVIISRASCSIASVLSFQITSKAIRSRRIMSAS